jgi:hypothetical protein
MGLRVVPSLFHSRASLRQHNPPQRRFFFLTPPTLRLNVPGGVERQNQCFHNLQYPRMGHMRITRALRKL